MSNWDLVPQTLNYGREHSNNSSIITLVVLLMFIFTTIAMIKLHFKLTNNTRFSKGKKQLLKLLPISLIIIVILITLFYFMNVGIENKSPIWQSDYFVAFTLNFVIMLFSFISYISTTTVMKTETKKISMPIQRRKIAQLIINGIFKISFFFFWVLLLTPYYVLCVGQKQTLSLTNYYALLSLIIFIFMCTVCYFAFGRTPFAPLLPTVVLWGACFSLYDWTVALGYGITWNGSGFALTAAGFLFGYGFLQFLKPVVQGHEGLFSMFYILFLWIIIAGTWLFIWIYYGVEIGGQPYKTFRWESFVPND